MHSRRVLLSRSAGSPHTHVASSLDAALELVASHKDDIFRVFVIGGASLYEETLPYAQRLLLTRISKPEYPQCDVFFPKWETTQFTCKTSDDLREWVFSSTSGISVPDEDIIEGDVHYRYEMWERV